MPTSPETPPVKNCRTCAHCKRFMFDSSLDRCLAIKAGDSFCASETDIRFEDINQCGVTRKLWTKRRSLRRFIADMIWN